MDNYGTHKTEAVKRWLLRRPRLHIHFTPTSSSWLNLVESLFSIVQRRVLRRAVQRSTQALERDLRVFLGAHNADPKPFVWTKSADETLSGLKRYCTEVNEVRSERARRRNWGFPNLIANQRRRALVGN